MTPFIIIIIVVIIVIFFWQNTTFIGVNCDTNDAKFVKLSSTNSGDERTYKCFCEGTLSMGMSNLYCYMHYWEC